MRTDRLLVSLLSLVALVAAAATARAEGAAPSGNAAAPGVAAADQARAPALRHTLLVGARLGGLFPVNGLGPGLAFQLELGYAPPILKGRLALILDVGYSQHSKSSTDTDPRLVTTTTEYTTSLTQRDLGLFIGPQIFILDPRGRFVPYVAAGVDVHFLETAVSAASGGVPFGENRETSSVVGFATRAGFGYRLGPGLLVGEVSYSWAPVSQDVTGRSDRGGVGLLVGYTFTFGLGG